MGDQDSVGAVETKAMSAGQQQWVLEKLQTDWTGQLRLKRFHLQAKQSGNGSEIQGSRSAICRKRKESCSLRS